MRTGIILAGFGSTHPEAGASIRNILKRVSATYPDVPCLVGTTSRTVRKRMADTGPVPRSVAHCLDELRDRGVEAAVIQSLHIIPGREYHDLLELAQERRASNDPLSRVEIGFPLLAGERDMDRVVKAILDIVPERRGSHEAAVLMGHGTLHPGNAFYEGLGRRLRAAHANVFIGTMDARPGIGDILRLMRENGITKAYLLPFLFGAGVHAARDMTGDHDGSWKSVLEGENIRCDPISRGAGEYEQFADIWMDHLAEALDRLADQDESRPGGMP